MIGGPRPLERWSHRPSDVPYARSWSVSRAPYQIGRSAAAANCAPSGRHVAAWALSELSAVCLDGDLREDRVTAREQHPRLRGVEGDISCRRLARRERHSAAVL